MQLPIVIKQGTNSSQVGMQPGMVTVPMTVNSSMAASIPNVMRLNKPGGQNIVVTAQNLGSAQPTIIPSIQILNMRPRAPALAAQKSAATVSPKVVIGTPQVFGARATASIPRQSLQRLQPGQQGHFLLKTENGQYQLLRMGPAPAASTLTAPQAQTIRLSTMMAHPGVATFSTRVAAPGPMTGQMPAPPIAAPVVASVPSVAVRTSTPLRQQPRSTTHIKRAQKNGAKITILQNIPVHMNINMNKMGKAMSVNSKAKFPRSTVVTTSLSTVLTPGKSLLKDKEKKSSGQFSQPFVNDKMAGDDDINDVAAMGGVNLAEESQRILGSTEMIGTQIRSCKEELLMPTSLMQARLKVIASKHNMGESAPEVAKLMIHAVQERLKTLVEKLATIAQHRIDMDKNSDNQYEITQDVKGQLKFLEESDHVAKKRREDSERKMLLLAAKSRSKKEDPEQAKLKAKAKEMQQAELEELRQRQANLTALQAIGPRKKARLDLPGGSGDSISTHIGHSTPSGSTAHSQMALRTRLKRINMRDMIFLMEQDRDLCRSKMLYKLYLK